MFYLFQILAPRIGYLPLLAPQVKPFFSGTLPPGVDTVWFEYKGLPLKWYSILTRNCIYLASYVKHVNCNKLVNNKSCFMNIWNMNLASMKTLEL